MICLAREHKRFFTIMIIPHSERTVRSFRVPLAYVEAVLTVLGLVGLALLIFTNSYQKMTANMGELRQLRQVTAEQREQLDSLSKETEAVQDSLRKLEDLDRQVREMMKLGPKPTAPAPKDGNSVGLAPVSPNYRPTLRDAARVASLGGPGFPVGSAETSGLIAALGPQSSEVGSSRGGLEVSAQMLAELGQAKAEIETRQTSLEQLHKDVAEKLRYLAAKPSIWPSYGQITSDYGYRRNPYGWGSEFHPGVDIAAPYGSPVYATGDGVVVEAGWDGGYGKKVTVDHGYGFVTIYGHNSRIAVEVGDHVKKGQVVAYVGMTGRTTGPHVHYEVHVNGTLVNARNYLTD